MRDVIYIARLVYHSRRILEGVLLDVSTGLGANGEDPRAMVRFIGRHAGVPVSLSRPRRVIAEQRSLPPVWQRQQGVLAASVTSVKCAQAVPERTKKGEN